MNKRPEVTTNPEGKSQRILVMDDEQTIAEALKRVLLEQGYAVELAMTGKDALVKSGQQEFDLLIADLRLPDINGMDVIKNIKCEHPATKVVVITGYPSVPSAVEAMKLGVFDYLSKPFGVDELNKVLSAALNKEETGLAKPVPDEKDAQEDILILKREIHKALQRAARDEQFWKDIFEHGTAALKDFPLKPEAKVAIVSGDLQWFKEHIGEVEEDDLALITKIEEREVW
jgi:DNA-binding NtrC family response regulator